MINPLNQKEKNQRLIWASTRSVLEVDNYKHKRSGQKSKSRWSLFTRILGVFVVALKTIGLYNKGLANIFDIKINRHRLVFKNLPAAFDGFKILHLTDLHLDIAPGIEEAILEQLKKLDFDLCVFTGDYREASSGPYKQILAPLKRIFDKTHGEFKPIAVLGNHDTYLLTKHEVECGIRFLINETVELNRGDDKIIISGADDPFSYYTDAVLDTFTDKKGFKIALVHTSELADVAAENEYSLYLCGHTHGGQICLPNGRAIISHQSEGYKYIKGFWRVGDMQGYTSVGCGASGIPIRFNCQPEIALFELRNI